MNIRILGIFMASIILQAAPVLAADFSLCRFHNPALPDETVVYAAELYRGANSNWQGDKGRIGQVKVAVNSPERPVVLVLTAFESTVWHIGWTEGTRILAVAASGYYDQVVAGLPPETEILLSSSSSRNDLCPYFAGPPDSAKKARRPFPPQTGRGRSGITGAAAEHGPDWGTDGIDIWQRLQTAADTPGLKRNIDLNQFSQLLTGRYPETGFGLTASGRLLFGPGLSDEEPVFTARELSRADFDPNLPLDDFLISAIRQKRIKPATPGEYMRWAEAKNASAGRADEAITLPSELISETPPSPAWAYLVLEKTFTDSLPEALTELSRKGDSPLVFFLPPGLEPAQAIDGVLFLRLDDGSCLGDGCQGIYGRVRGMR